MIFILLPQDNKNEAELKEHDASVSIGKWYGIKNTLLTLWKLIVPDYENNN
jgi:hypothetical protein